MADKLAKAVSINGTKFDGSSDIAVNAANDSTLVHKSGNESIAGNKELTGETKLSGGLQLVSPNGLIFSIQVDDTGNLKTNNINNEVQNG